MVKAMDRKITRNKNDLSGFQIALKKMKRHWQLYLVVAVPLFFIILFCYGPMYGIQIAFKDFVSVDGIFGSEWVGLKHFKNFLSSYQFRRLLGNTLGISLYTLIAGFPIPILLAVSLNECNNKIFKKTVQMVSYAPHFISVVVMDQLRIVKC